MNRPVFAQAGLSDRGMCGLAALVTGVVFSGGTAAGLDTRWIFLGSIALFGLAHGACDLWLPGWVAGQKMTGKFLVGFCLMYLGAAAAVFLFWRWFPDAAAAGFLLLTAWHWGSADAVLTGVRSWRLGLLAWGRGLMVLTAPAAFHPHAALQVLAALAPDTLSVFSPARLHVAAVVIMSLGIGMQMLVWPSPPYRRELAGHHLESLFLLGLFAAFAPLVATALYFIWFHAWRHILRLSRRQSPGTTNLLLRVSRFHWAALPCGFGALILLWLVARWWPGDLLRAYLILLSAVTLPHAALVLWLDRVESSQDQPVSGPTLRSTTVVRWFDLAH